MSEAQRTEKTELRNRWSRHFWSPERGTGSLETWPRRCCVCPAWLPENDVHPVPPSKCCVRASYHQHYPWVREGGNTLNLVSHPTTQCWWCFVKKTIQLNSCKEKSNKQLTIDGKISFHGDEDACILLFFVLFFFLTSQIVLNPFFGVSHVMSLSINSPRKTMGLLIPIL